MQRRSRAFVGVGIAFLVIGLSRIISNSGGTGAAFLAIGVVFLVLGIGRNGGR